MLGQLVERDTIGDTADSALKRARCREPERERVGQLPLEGATCDGARDDGFRQLTGHHTLIP